jgi:PQQ-like domain
MTAAWRIPAYEPERGAEVTLSDDRSPAGDPVIVPERFGEPLVVVPVKRGEGPGLMAWGLATGDVRFDVALGDASLRVGPVAVDDEGALLVGLFDRFGLFVHVVRVDGRGRELARDSFKRVAFEGNLWPASECSLTRLEALAGGAYALSWFDEDEPYDVGHAVRGLRPGARAGWIAQGDIKICVGQMLVGHRVARLDRIASQRPIVGRRLADGVEIWSRAPKSHDYEQIFAAFGGILLVNNERRRIAQMPTGAIGPADTPALLTLLDAATGRPRWQRAVDGFIASVCAGPDEAALVVSNHDGWGQLARLDTAGALQFSASLLVGPPTPSRYGEPRRADWPHLIAFDGARVVLSLAGELRCCLAADIQKVAWRLALGDSAAEWRVFAFAEALLARTGRRFVALGARAGRRG